MFVLFFCEESNKKNSVAQVHSVSVYGSIMLPHVAMPYVYIIKYYYVYIIVTRQATRFKMCAVLLLSWWYHTVRYCM